MSTIIDFVLKKKQFTSEVNCKIVIKLSKSKIQFMC